MDDTRLDKFQDRFHTNTSMRRLIIAIIILIIALSLLSGLQRYSPAFQNLFHAGNLSSSDLSLPSNGKVQVVSEESDTINIVKKVGPSVVTVSEIAAPQSSSSSSPFDSGPFSFFGIHGDNSGNGGSDSLSPAPDQAQSIGSGFIISADGLIVTNKHVVSDTGGKYTVTTSDGKKYTVQQIYRDPLNDVALVKINTSDNPGKILLPVTLGDSTNLQVGQYAVAIGSALGQFQNTVTTGVVSGLGRQITAGDPYAGEAENLTNVIQTSAAISPGNSGGPLLDSSGRVIGVNTAVSQSGQNIGFALPINSIKDSLSNFNQTGQFNRPYIGVAYRMLSKATALANDVPQGAYLQDVIKGSPADKAGLQAGDIITQIDNQKIADKTEIATVIAKKKVGDAIAITYSRNSNTNTVRVQLVSAPQQ